MSEKQPEWANDGAAEVMAALEDRKGLGFSGIDAETLVEIKAEMSAIIAEAAEKNQKLEAAAEMIASEYEPGGKLDPAKVWPDDAKVSPDGVDRGAQANQSANKIAQLQLQRGCLLAGPGRGDCEHFIGQNDNTDEYGVPVGWCIVCHAMAQRNALQAIQAEAVEVLEEYATCSDGCTCGDGWSHDSAKALLAKLKSD